MKERRNASASALLLGLALLAASVPCAIAQQVTAAITGRVTDPSGAGIGGAKVTATDTDRGSAFPTTTDSDGVYNLPRLPIGNYNLKIEAQGFQAAQMSNVQLNLNQTARADVALQVGSIATSVEVMAAAPILQTDTTEISTVIDAHTNVTLPLATRNYVQLTLLAPGAVHPDPGSFQNGQTTASSGRPYINGNREQANNFLLDGLDNNQVSDNLVGYAPSVDAIQEFNEITQNAPAEFGNYMGGIISTSIKSGTNAFHGNLFEFFRNDVLNANEWSNNFTGADRAKLRWNNFGGTIGGPIRRDKLFFFADYQGSRFDKPGTAEPKTVLTTAERQGDFSQLLTRATPIQLYNPFSLDANGNRVPFANNQIPLSLLSPAALKIANSTLYPAPINGNLQNNILNTNTSAINADQGDVKIDYNASESSHFFGRYSQSFVNNPGTNSLPLLYNSFAEYPTYGGVLNWTKTISPSLVNEARFGVNYVRVNNGSAPNGADASSFGIPGVPDVILPAMSIGDNGGFATTIGSANNYQLFADTVIQYGDTVVWTRGSHTMHIGFQGWRYRINTFYAGNNGKSGTFWFDGRYTAGPGPLSVAGADTGLADADFMLGLPRQIGAGVNGGTWGQRSNTFASFFQDDWHVSSNLTLNLGLRYELHTPWVEVKDRQANFTPIAGQVEIAGQNGASRALYNQYNGILNWQPRIGFAWKPGIGGTSTVVRGAYSLSSYLEGTGTNLRPTINPPFAVEHNATYTSTPLPGSTLDQGFLPLQGNVADPYAGTTLRLWDPNVKPAFANQWSLNIQHQFGQTTTAQIGYVGQRTTHLMVTMPYLQKKLLPDGKVVNSDFLAGNPALQADISQISGTESNGNQSYNALQAVLQKRLSDGLEFSVAYTYSKCMTDSSGYYGSWGAQAKPTSPYWQNLYDKKAEWGPCYYDATHVLSSYATYDLPFGRDRKFGKSMNKVVNAVAGDWQISAIPSFHTGFPLTVDAGDASGTNSRGSRANCLAPVKYLDKTNSPSGGYQWFDPSSFGAPAPGTFGTCGVATVRGPGLGKVDFSAMKFFPITERQRIEFRGEFINLTNTPILAAPNASLGGSLGLLQTSQGARNIQFALKYSF